MSEPEQRRVPAPLPSRLRARAAAIVIPPIPTTREELIAALESISYVRRPRTLQQLERQYVAYMLWVEDVPIAEIARRLRVSRETIRNDLYFEGRLRADGRRQTVAERCVSDFDVAACFKAWGLSTREELEEFVAALTREHASPGDGNPAFLEPR